MIRKLISRCEKYSDRISRDRVGAYAAQSAFFLVLSLIPMILLLMTLVQYTPISQADVIEAVYETFPKTIRMTVISIVNEVYNQSKAMIPVTVLVTMWSAGRGVLAITSGLNSIHGEIETRNYIILRVRAAFYTVLFILVIALSLILLGFGNSISVLVNRYVPVLEYITEFIIEIRTVTTLLILIVFSICIYKFLPNYRGKIRFQVPGAVFTAFGWTFASFIISIYMDIFKGFSNMYGSLTTIVLIMLWLYFCMYIMLLGGEINVLLEEYLDIKNECDKIDKDMDKKSNDRVK